MLCVTREQSLTASQSPAADRLSACPVVDQLCRRFGAIVDESPGKSVAEVPMPVISNSVFDIEDLLLDRRCGMPRACDGG